MLICSGAADAYNFVALGQFSGCGSHFFRGTRIPCARTDSLQERPQRSPRQWSQRNEWTQSSGHGRNQRIEWRERPQRNPRSERNQRNERIEKNRCCSGDRIGTVAISSNDLTGDKPEPDVDDESRRFFRDGPQSARYQ